MALDIVVGAWWGRPDLNQRLRGCYRSNSRGPKPRIITMLDYGPYGLIHLGVNLLVEEKSTVQIGHSKYACIDFWDEGRS